MVLYRGDCIESFNEDEFEDNNINGTAIDVYFLRGEPERVEMPARYTVKQLPHTTVEHTETKMVAGGLTKSLGTAIHFSTSRCLLGLVLFLDHQKVPGKLVTIQYQPRFFNRHPALAAYIFSIEDTAIVVNGELVGLARTREDGKKSITTWVGKGMMDQLTAGEGAVYPFEKEVVAYAPYIRLDESLLGIGSYYGAGMTTSSMRAVLTKLFPHFSSYNIKNWSLETKVEKLYTETVKRMAWYEEDLAIIVLETLNPPAFKTGQNYVPKDNFKVLYTGTNFIYNYERAGVFVGRSAT